jgi:phosphoribosylformylglycinamidine cyclo-ligase
LQEFKKMTEICILAGSKSDQDVVEKVLTVLKERGVDYSFHVASAHREPQLVTEIVNKSDAKVFICVAGLSAALPGFVASLTGKPVIGVPVSAKLGGLDALLSITQMPRGVPVAAVGIDNGANAAHLALRILERAPQEAVDTYAKAGVDLVHEGKIIEILGKYTKQSFSFGKVLAEFGHYANLVEFGDYAFALATDGVGSKVILATKVGKYDTVGIDCIAMNVNDIICLGAKPIGFVDYLAYERLTLETVEGIAQGLLEGARQANIPILGGETATLPDLVKGFDLAGTALGVVRKDKVITGQDLAAGDILLGLPSSGIHSNGLTLARKVAKLDDALPDGTPVSESLLTPTRIYVKEVMQLLDEVPVKGLAHITGGGIRKLKQLNSNVGYKLDNWPDIPPIFTYLQERGSIANQEMFKTFNMGIGFVIAVSKTQKSAVQKVIPEAIPLGAVTTGDKIIVEKFDVKYKLGK